MWVTEIAVTAAHRRSTQPCAAAGTHSFACRVLLLSEPLAEATMNAMSFHQVQSFLGPSPELNRGAHLG